MKKFLLSILLLSNSVLLADTATDIHLKLPVVDGHNDLPWTIRQSGKKLEDIDLSQMQNGFHTDLVRLRKGGVGLQLWSAYVPASTDQAKTALKTTLEQIDLIHKMHKMYPNDMQLVNNLAGVELANKSGKIAGMIGVEGGYSIEGELGNIQKLFDLGVRYMTITHSKNIFWADSATDVEKHKGLTEFGVSVIEEMNRVGMLVDISHVSKATMKDALKASKTPIIASHSSAYSLTKNARNIDDEVLKLVAVNGGVVMINFYSGYINQRANDQLAAYDGKKSELREKYPDDKIFYSKVQEHFRSFPIQRGDVGDVVDHIEHVIKVAGVDHVGLGSDFDGVPTLPKDLEDVSKFPNITRELLKRDHTEADILKILGGNFLRVLDANEAYVRSLRKNTH